MEENILLSTLTPLPLLVARKDLATLQGVANGSMSCISRRLLKEKSANGRTDLRVQTIVSDWKIVFLPNGLDTQAGGQSKQESQPPCLLCPKGV